MIEPLRVEKIKTMEVKKYFLDYNFDLEKKFFEGRVKIYLNFSVNKRFVDLDAEELDIKSVKVNDNKASFKLLKGKLRIFSKFKKENLIEINFGGQLKEKLGGIYLSRYKDGNQEKFLITTQFEPVEAKTAFPCFDHPNYKSVFELSLTFDKNLKAISNTLPLKEEIIGDKKKVIFKETPRMSTYLLYLGIGDFEFLKSKYKNILLRVVTTKGKSKAGKFALEVAKKCLEYFEKVFSEPYPLEKLDLIAIPDFAAGAMENWGAITFREELLLVFKGITPELRKKIIAEVIAHEISHMWFGNLVTMKWWDDLWLNESFATYLAYKAIDNYYPRFEKMKDFLLDEILGAISRDVYLSTHPIKAKVKNPEEIDDIFDEISYNKGGSILRTLNLFLGDQKFFAGLRDYIKKYKYQNAEANDLWNSMEKVSGYEVKKIMNDYVTKTGTPIVYFKKEKNRFYLKQNRFTLEKDFNQEWNLPLFIKINNKKEKKIVIKKRKIRFELKNELPILNSNFSGYYLTGYPKEILPKIIEKANENELLNILTTYRLLTLRGDLGLKEFYEFFSKIKNKDFSKFSRAILVYLGMVEDDYLRFNFSYLSDELKEISKKILEKFGSKIKAKEPIKIKELKLEALFNLTYYFEETSLIEKLLNELKKTKNLFEKINPEIKVIVFTLLANKDYQALLDYYEKTNIIEEKRKVILALSRIKEETLFSKFLDFLLTEKVRFNQTFIFFAGMRVNKNKEKIVFNWLKNNFKKLETKGGMGKELSVIKNIIKSSFNYFGPLVSEKEIIDFVKENNLNKKFPQTLPFILEKIKIERRFIKRNKDETIFA